MAKVATNKKYLTLDEVRVSHKPSSDNIHLVSADADLPQGFQLTLQKGTHVEQQMRTCLLQRGSLLIKKLMQIFQISSTGVNSTSPHPVKVKAGSSREET